MDLPSLVYNFNHSNIDGMTFGPRREITLAMSVLVFDGQNGRYVSGVVVRFGGVEDLDAVRRVFASVPKGQSDLAGLRYSETTRSKPGRLVFDLNYERIDLHLEIRCSSLQISGPG